ncbi:uncharacterized protein LOC134784290 [Penaeus indicus]|uniref:uncharacterized protein LOC134784290 n=1 Tax=Penaeus indicus TaxID=29960 RepID=UPI00300CFB9F
MMQQQQQQQQQQHAYIYNGVRQSQHLVSRIYNKLKMNCLLLLLVAVGLSCVMVAHASPTIGLLAGYGSLRPFQYQPKRHFHGPGYGRYHGHGYRAPPRRYRPHFGVL